MYGCPKLECYNINYNETHYNEIKKQLKIITKYKLNDLIYSKETKINEILNILYNKGRISLKELCVNFISHHITYFRKELMFIPTQLSEEIDYRVYLEIEEYKWKLRQIKLKKKTDELLKLKYNIALKLDEQEKLKFGLSYQFMLKK
jgi:hypothetical protein